MSKTLADILRSYIPDGDGYNSEYAHNLNAAADALESQHSTPAGYVMVPVEPTPEMRLAGKRTIKGAADCSEGEQAEYAYMQMVAAAPKAEQPPVQEPSFREQWINRPHAYGDSAAPQPQSEGCFACLAVQEAEQEQEQ